MIFHDDIKITLYSLEIIETIIKMPIPQVTSPEAAFRLNWVERFLQQGGFQQLQVQIKRAMTLSREVLKN